MSLFRRLLRVPVMKLFNTMKRAVQTPTARTAPEVKKQVAPLAPRVDSFQSGHRVKVGKAEAHSTPNAIGVSVTHGADTFGVSGRISDGAATLGAVAIKLGRVEGSVGLMPAAPAPTPVPAYLGKPREE
ncbi:MAG: hypothetical protein AB1938_32590 [Myxococcota bacterium]